ncbi:hypothetical protein ZWY2020_037993 [Hordeum vulgare]|nr:hypothetical protein ZWY2020_037993 [Hordeum vulgare]
MAIRNVTAATRSLDGDMTVDEFKEWLRQRFDVDRDSRISRDELRCAMRTIRTRFSGYQEQAWHQYADTDGDGYVDDGEVDSLISTRRGPRAQDRRLLESQARSIREAGSISIHACYLLE